VGGGASNPHAGQGRVVWVDAARCVAMFLVFFGHLGPGWFPALGPLIAAVYTFHMPLFFLLSGLFFSPAIRFRALLAKRAKTLLVPYYVFSSFALVVPLVKLLRPSLYAQAGKSTAVDPLRDVTGILLAQGGSGLWFLWSLFSALLFLWCLARIAKGNRIALFALFAAFVGLGYAVGSSAVFPMLPFQLGNLFKATAWVGFGYLLARSIDIKRLDRLPLAGRLAAAIALFALFAASFLMVSAYQQAHGSTPLFYLCRSAATVLGIAMAIALSLLLPSLSWISTIGRCSLVFYALNDISLKTTKFALFSLARIHAPAMALPAQLAIGLLAVILAMSACYWANILIQRHARWTLGDL
jgi:fucose 4-O-acetylase-like acetyltransferase